MTDWQRSAVDEMPAVDRAEALRAKAKFLHDTACSLQDQLERVPVFLGDVGLIESKQAIQKACDRARRAAERVLYGRRSA